MQFKYKVKDSKENIFEITIWKNNLKEVVEYLLDSGLVIVEGLELVLKPIKEKAE